MTTPTDPVPQPPPPAPVPPNLPPDVLAALQNNPDLLNLIRQRMAGDHSAGMPTGGGMGVSQPMPSGGGPHLQVMPKPHHRQQPNHHGKRKHHGGEEGNDYHTQEYRGGHGGHQPKHRGGHGGGEGYNGGHEGGGGHHMQDGHGHGDHQPKHKGKHGRIKQSNKYQRILENVVDEYGDNLEGTKAGEFLGNHGDKIHKYAGYVPDVGHYKKQVGRFHDAKNDTEKYDIARSAIQRAAGSNFAKDNLGKFSKAAEYIPDIKTYQDQFNRFGKAGNAGEHARLIGRIGNKISRSKFARDILGSKGGQVDVGELANAVSAADRLLGGRLTKLAVKSKEKVGGLFGRFKNFLGKFK